MGGEESGSTGQLIPETERAEDLRVICHVDVDCFYAACERLREPELVGEPVVVGMGYEPGEPDGAVATASYEARAHGVESAQAISTALEHMPRRADHPDRPDSAHYRPVDMEFYESVATDIKSVLRDHADTVRNVSIDEAYLDATDRTDWERVDGRPLAEGYARHIKRAVERDVGLTVSVGVAPDMSTAKIASDHDKPDGLVVVPPDEVRSFLAPLPVDAINGVGPVRARELGEMGIDTIGDLARADPSSLVDRFGDHGRTICDRARGRDRRPVEPRGRPKSLSRESAFANSVTDEAVKRERIVELAADVARRAQRKGALYRTIGIKVVTPPFEVNTRARTLPGHVDDPSLLERVALDLAEEFAADPVRKLGVRVQGLSFDATDQERLDGYATRDNERTATLPDGARPRRSQSSLEDFQN